MAFCRKYVILVAVVFCGHFANAGLYLEPYVGYGVGSFTGDITVTEASTSADVKLDWDASGPTFGGKVGIGLIPLLTIGADYQSLDFDLTSNNDEVENSSLKGSSYGPFVQLSLPLFKFSATYFLSADSEGDDEYEGKAMKVGVGFTGLPFIAINVDYLTISYDKATSGDSSQTIDKLEADVKVTILSVSLPLSI
jgi:hypothetical protein